MPINHYIANATGELTKLTGLIETSLHTVIPIVEKELQADQIDIIFISAAALAIPEYGIGGNSPGPNHVYVSFDSDSPNITQAGLNETLFHEIHHCMRYRNPGYGETLGETMITEGLACLYEEQHSGKAPLYAKVQLKDSQVKKAKKLLQTKGYNHGEWFFGNGTIDRWFGYTYGYKLCKAYADKTNKKASQLVHIPAQKIFGAIDS